MKLKTRKVYNVIGTFTGSVEPGMAVAQVYCSYKNFYHQVFNRFFKKCLSSQCKKSKCWLLCLNYKDRMVLLGNHRDGWIFGAVDPSSGTAAMMEVARELGIQKRKGCKKFHTCFESLQNVRSKPFWEYLKLLVRITIKSMFFLFFTCAYGLNWKSYSKRFCKFLHFIFSHNQNISSIGKHLHL